MLQIHSLCVKYGGCTVLQDIDLEVRPGEILAVVGPNGAGKTTLIRALSGVLPIAGGKITIAGQDLLRLPSEQRARLLAVVPQARELPGAYSVFQTVMMGRTPYLGWLGHATQSDLTVTCQAMECTRTMDLSDRCVGELSGGEQQRVLLARALAQATPILLLDEPTAHLDLQHQSLLLNLVAHSVHQRNLAVLIALHDLNLVSLYADRVALILDGHIAAIGTPAEVLLPELIQRAYGVPVHIIQHPDYGIPLVLPDGRYPGKQNAPIGGTH